MLDITTDLLRSDETSINKLTKPSTQRAVGSRAGEGEDSGMVGVGRRRGRKAEMQAVDLAGKPAERLIAEQRSAAKLCKAWVGQQRCELRPGLGVQNR